jgi:hypothetical protein
LPPGLVPALTLGYLWATGVPLFPNGGFDGQEADRGPRKLAEFDAQTWHALNLLSRESMKTFQELADEAFRDLLHKYKRPTDLKAALRESAKGEVAGRRRPRAR